MKAKPLSLRQAMGFAWTTFKKRWGLFSAVLLTMIAAWVALEIVVIGGERFGFLLWAVAHLVFLVFFAGLEVGFLRLCLDLRDGGEPTFAGAFSHLALGPKFLLGQAAYVLMVAVGLLLLVIPGLYLGVRYSLFGFRLATGEGSLIRSFQQSAVLSAGRVTYLLRVLIALFLLNLVGASLMGFGLFIAIPLSGPTMAAVYRQLSPR